MKHTPFAIIKIVLIIIALSVASFLAFSEKSEELTPDHKIVFVLDINRTMNTQDVLSGTKHISRIVAAKSLIKRTILSEPWYSYGLILFNATADYIVPPTFDTWTFLLYLSGITTNLLPDWTKNFAQLTWLLHSSYTSYLIISDFDTTQQASIKLPKWISLLGLWSLVGDKVRHPNGNLDYYKGKPVFSARNDQFAQSLNLPYTTLTHVDWFSLQKLLSGFMLPLSQRIILYILLGVLVILVVFL